MQFTKMHGTGNDFIMVDNFDGKIKLTPEQVVKLCNRHFGIGADGVILVETSDEGDAFMNYYNADGSFAEMCGNGTRCTAHFMREFGRLESDILALETHAGIKKIDLLSDDLFRVNMGSPTFAPHPDFPVKAKDFGVYEFHFASMGNPHAVTIAKDEVEAIKVLHELAPKMEIDLKHFPNRINVSVVWQKDHNHFGAKTHERGCGQTLACGTAMSATFALLTKNEVIDGKNKIQIDVPGGILFFEYNEKNEILMTGSSKIVYKGEINL